LHIDTGVNKRIIKADRVFCLKKRRLALEHNRQTGTKKLAIKNCRYSLADIARLAQRLDCALPWLVPVLLRSNAPL
jgi:hypothetical protein